MGLVMGKTILQMDEPEHRLHRALVSPTFRSKVLEQWEGDLVQRVVDELIDGFAGDGSADLVQELTFNFPVQVIAQILGLPRSDFPRSSGGRSRSPAWPPTGNGGWRRPRRLRDYFADVLAERRAAAGRRPDQRPAGRRGGRTRARRRGDLLVPPAAAPGRGRDHLPGVGEPPLRPADQSRPAPGRARGPVAAARCLRGDHPLGAAGHRHPAPGHRRHRAGRRPRRERGPTSGLLLGSANRDERKYENPDRFDIFRASRQSLGFGFGVHVCLGMHLARMETRVAMNTLFDRLPDMRLAPAPGRTCTSRAWRSGRRSPCRSRSPRPDPLPSLRPAAAVLTRVSPMPAWLTETSSGS